jgi:peptide deformylase
MALLQILHYPDERLRTIAQPVPAVDDEIRRLAADMIETMYAAQGIGLAATQVNVHKRVIVIDVSESQDEPRVFINPRVLEASPEQVESEEGCLSVPGVFDTVRRPAQVRVEALGLDGSPVAVDADQLLAVCIQHEIDHLDGKVFVDYLSRLKQARIAGKLRKQQRKVM